MIPQSPQTVNTPNTDENRGQETRHRLAGVNPAEQLAALLDDNTLPASQAGLLWAGLLIGTELYGIRCALEDIADALTAPADDDPIITE